MKNNDIGYTPEQIEEMVKAFKENDITEGYFPDSIVDMPPEKSKIFKRTQKIFKEYWNNNLEKLGIKQSSKNFTADYPLNVLMKADSNIIAKEVADLYENPNIQIGDENINCYDFFFSTYQEPIFIGLNGYAKKLGKSINKLTNDEIMFVIREVADVINNEHEKVVMLAQQVPALADLSKLTQVDEDFNNSVNENHPKIDFMRKQYGLRRKFDNLLSFEELTENNLMGLSPEDEITDISDEGFEKVLIGFINTLDDTDKMICYLKMRGKTQTEIAKELGYKNHSAVTKRMAKVREKIPSYIENLNK